MKFSNKTTYGLRAMAYLSKQKREVFTSLSEIAQHEKISKKFLEQIFNRIKKAKLIKSQKGQSGGYKLSKNAGDISVFEIIKSIEGKISPTQCLTEDGNFKCSNASNCAIAPLLRKMQKTETEILKKTSLKEISKI